MEGKINTLKLIKRIGDIKFASSKNKNSIDLRCLLYIEETKLSITLKNNNYGK